MRMIHKTCFYTGIKYKFYTSFNVQRRETKLFLKKTNTQNTYHIVGNYEFVLLLSCFFSFSRFEHYVLIFQRSSPPL